METEGSTADEPTPDTDDGDAASADDATSQIEGAPESEVGEEAEEAHQADREAETDVERAEEGRLGAGPR